jgi:hypothetical protein
MKVFTDDAALSHTETYDDDGVYETSANHSHHKVTSSGRFGFDPFLNLFLAVWHERKEENAT